MYKVKRQCTVLRTHQIMQRVSCAFFYVAASSVCTVALAGDTSWQAVGTTGTAFSTSAKAEQPWQEVRSAGGGASADGWLETGLKDSSAGQPDRLAGKPPVGRPSDVSTDKPMQVETSAESQLVTFPGRTPKLDEPSLLVINEERSATTPLSVVDSTATINLDLFVGQVSVLGQVDVSRVAVGNGQIIRAQVLDTGELLVIAAAKGSSSLRLWNSDNTQTDYNIRVAETDPETRVPLERMVRMRVRMVEFRKSALGRLGIDWNDSATGPALAAAGEATGNSLLRPSIGGFEALAGSSSTLSAYFGIASNISSKINLLAQNGDAVTLAEPVLSAMNGGQASFLAGGEVPYPSVGDNGQTQVEFKEYGVKLNVAPLIDGVGNVRTVIETEISQLDESVSVQGTPGLLTRRAQTEVTVRSGETIVISGLLSSESGADTDMVPGLGRLPIIGRLFSSRSRRNSVNELVIFVTPEVIEPGQPMISGREQLYFNTSESRIDTLRQQLPLME